MTRDPDDSLKRIIGLSEAGGTPFVLALHAFIADFTRERPGTARRDPRLFSRLSTEKAVAEKAARAGLPLDGEEVLAASHNFLRFCAACGVESDALCALQKKIEAWEEKRAPQGSGGELSKLSIELAFAQEDSGRLLAQTAEWTRDKQRLAELEGEILRLQRAGAGAELEALTSERRALAEKLEGYRDLDLYVDQVKRFSLYTRTRMDYERGVMKLTAEQQEAVDAVRPGRDFLIRGGAGTGKTIVLLHALQNVRRARDSELALGPGPRILFLTYTNTLVKYDRYVAEILRGKEAEHLILTAESFFQARLGLLGQRQRMDYGIVPRLAGKLNTTGFFSQQELAIEVEEFIFGSLVSRREYVEEIIPRKGMRQPLSAGQRETVWGIRDRMAAEMEHDGVLSRNFSRMKLIQHLEAHHDDSGLRDVDFAFVDESQDLSAADLRALKLMTTGGLVMAGDTGQSIYGVSSPYRRAGVNITGRSRVLHTSFRTTVPIQRITDEYRALSGLEEDEGAGAVAFREGPVPELYTAATRGELAGLLLRKAALFIERIGYDPENITVLAPTKTDLATIGDLLGHAGYRYANIRDDDFSFKQENTIRLSTLHSSKGLDFAVVLLYLPALPPRGEYDDKAGALLVRNLIYVAMTRAMDNLNVFTLEGAHEGQQEEPLQDLVQLFRRR